MRRWIGILLIAVLLLALPSCGEEKGARATLDGILPELGPLPAGRLYDSEAAEWEDTYLDRALVTALFARADGTSEWEGRVEAGALYLASHAEPYLEVAVLLCYGSADCRAVIEMCLRRAALVTARLSLPDEAVTVVSRGRTVVLLLAEDEEVRDRFSRSYP